MPKSPADAVGSDEHSLKCINDERQDTKHEVEIHLDVIHDLDMTSASGSLASAGRSKTSSGCRVEHLPFHAAERLQRTVATNAVIAWRVMTLRGRQVPDCDRESLSTDAELAFLTDAVNTTGRRWDQPITSVMR